MSSVPAIITTSHATFLFPQFTQTITSTLPTLISWLNPIPPSLHSNLPATFFMYCIRAYRIHAPSAPTTLAIVPHAYPLICSLHQHCSYHKSTLKFLPTTIPVYHVFRSMQHQFMFKWTPSPSLPHVVHLVTLFSSQIRGCQASGGVLGFESRTRHVMFVYIPS